MKHKKEANLHLASFLYVNDIPLLFSPINLAGNLHVVYKITVACRLTGKTSNPTFHHHLLFCHLQLLRMKRTSQLTGPCLHLDMIENILYTLQ
ncbi:Uncharacterised protein [Streptococcus pneumoniae]|nr:Uncharacterised protein [Streptococcus pneumoniae]